MSRLIYIGQVAYETELSGTPTAVFTEIQLIGQFSVLGIIILILSNQNIVVILASLKSLCYGPQLFEIKILISSVFCILWNVQMMSSKSKQKLKFFDTSKMNKLKHEIENENQHYAQDFKQQFHQLASLSRAHFSEKQLQCLD